MRQFEDAFDFEIAPASDIVYGLRLLSYSLAYGVALTLMVLVVRT
jgi:hypothetical protein